MTKMRFDLMKREVEKLKGRNPASGIVLHFSDGSTRSFEIHQKSVIGLFCASMNLYHWSCYPEEHTRGKREEQAARRDVARNLSDREDPETGRPITKFDPLLELLGRAVRITGPAAHHLILEAWTLCRKRTETLRRGENFYFSRENPDPFFENCTVGRLEGNLRQQLPISASDPTPDGLTAQGAETQ